MRIKKMSKINQNKTTFQMIADVDGDIHDIFNTKMPENVPILPVRNLVLFPGVVSPILIGRDSSKILMQRAEKSGSVIGIVCQHDPDVEVPMQDDLYDTGVFAKVMKLLTLPNGNVTVIVQCFSRMHLKQITKLTPYLMGEVEQLSDLEPEKRDREFKTAIEDLRSQVNEYVSMSDEIPDEASFAIKNITNDIMALNFVCSNLPFSVKEKIKLLEMESVKERLFNMMKIINREINLLNLKADIRNRTSTSSRRTTSCSNRSRTYRQRWATNRPRSTSCSVRPPRRNGRWRLTRFSVKKSINWTT